MPDKYQQPHECSLNALMFNDLVANPTADAVANKINKATAYLAFVRDSIGSISIKYYFNGVIGNIPISAALWPAAYPTFSATNAPSSTTNASTIAALINSTIGADVYALLGYSATGGFNNEGAALANYQSYNVDWADIKQVEEIDSVNRVLIALNDDLDKDVVVGLSFANADYDQYVGDYSYLVATGAITTLSGNWSNASDVQPNRRGYRDVFEQTVERFFAASPTTVDGESVGLQSGWAFGMSKDSTSAEFDFGADTINANAGYVGSKHATRGQYIEFFRRNLLYRVAPGADSDFLGVNVAPASREFLEIDFLADRLCGDYFAQLDSENDDRASADDNLQKQIDQIRLLLILGLLALLTLLVLSYFHTKRCCAH